VKVAKLFRTAGAPTRATLFEPLKDNAELILPAVQAVAVRVAVLPLPDPSPAVAPEPSSKVQRPTGPVPPPPEAVVNVQV
jgi:hypothetical protein